MTAPNKLIIMKKTALVLCMLLCASAFVLFTGCISENSLDPENTTTEQTLLVYSGAGLSAPMKEIGPLFKDKYGVNIDYKFGGAGALLPQMELTHRGDVFIAGGMPAYDVANKKGFVEDRKIVAYHVPIVVMPRGNPAQITSITDLGKPGIKLAMGDANATAVGKQGNKILEKNGVLDEAKNNIVVRTATVNELVTYVNTGKVDAAILMEDLYDPETMDCITIPVEENVISVLPISVLKFTEKKDLAEQFVDFVVSDEGKKIFAKHHFTPYPDPAYGNITI